MLPDGFILFYCLIGPYMNTMERCHLSCLAICSYPPLLFPCKPSSKTDSSFTYIPLMFTLVGYTVIYLRILGHGWYINRCTIEKNCSHSPNLAPTLCTFWPHEAFLPSPMVKCWQAKSGVELVEENLTAVSSWVQKPCHVWKVPSSSAYSYLTTLALLVPWLSQFPRALR